ncbi:MAG: GmrSD restriction endonuclease domain-containing protein, partial [Syntrophomonadaceae bacterium]
NLCLLFSLASNESMSITTFDSTKEYLFKLLTDIGEGKIQLPDFQRGWVWDDDHIKSILASVSLSYPIGAVMMMETGNADVRFKTRLVEGVELDSKPEPDELVLDGQQRLTSLYQALFCNKPVLTRDIRNIPIERWYYIDIEKALDPNIDREEAIFSVPAEKVKKDLWGNPVEDYSTWEKEYEAGVFPLALIQDYFEWKTGYDEYHNYNKEQLKQFNEFSKEIIKRFEQYQVPVITLGKATPKEAVCQVFEKVNTGGVSLNVFELLTATYAAENFQLRDDWEKRKRQIHEYKVLRSIENTDFLQAVTLLATYAQKQNDPKAPVSCKRKDILSLSLEDYQAYADIATDGFIKAAKFLHSQKIFDSRDLPYRTQIVPLASTMGYQKDKAENDGVKSKLARWYWCGVLGELYGSAVETRFAKDFPELISWIEKGTQLTTTIQDANFTASRLYTLRSRNSAAYKGISALLLMNGGLDFRSGYSIDNQMYFDEKIDIHHNFPRKFCQLKGIDPKHCDCIVNKTPLSAKTNRMIGGKAPSEYINRLQKSAEIEQARMNEILESHLIDPQAVRQNNFESFFNDRLNKILNIIEDAMGKAPAVDIVQYMMLQDQSEHEEFEDDRY